MALQSTKLTFSPENGRINKVGQVMGALGDTKMVWLLVFNNSSQFTEKVQLLEAIFATQRLGVEKNRVYGTPKPLAMLPAHHGTRCVVLGDNYA